MFYYVYHGMSIFIYFFITTVEKIDDNDCWVQEDDYDEKQIKNVWRLNEWSEFTKQFGTTSATCRWRLQLETLLERRKKARHDASSWALEVRLINLSCIYTKWNSARMYCLWQHNGHNWRKKECSIPFLKSFDCMCPLLFIKYSCSFKMYLASKRVCEVNVVCYP